MLYDSLEPNAAPYLNELDRDIFTFPMNCPDMFRDQFIELFYLTYAHRQIGTPLVHVFKQWVAQIFTGRIQSSIDLWNSTYMIDDPFITTDMLHKNIDTTKRKSKLYGDYKSHNWDATQSVDNSANYDYGVSETEDISHMGETDQGVDKNKEKHDEKFTETEGIVQREWFADTPQSVLMSGTDKPGVPIDPKVSADNLFNDGYLTTYRKNTSDRKKDNYTEGGSGAVKETYLNKQSVGGNSNAGFSTSYGSGSNTSATTGDGTSKTNTAQTTGSIYESKQKRHRKGFEGVEKSVILEKYRKTLINVLQDFVDEFEDCFMGVF